jgi:quinolinate synthase
MDPRRDRDLPVELAAAIRALRDERRAVILAHYYQLPDIQDVADLVGDSLQLARRAATTDAEVIAFCGVHFMAETALILAPGKVVVVPDLSAGCSLAESAPPDAFRAFLARYPDHLVVTYINSTAAVKALSDYCVTSANAVELVRSLPRDRGIVFAPDRYLGDYIIRQTGRDDIVLWDGTCEVHELFSGQAIEDLQAANPGIITLVHPECPEAVRHLADVIGSTQRLLDAVRAGAPDATYLVVTEPGIIHQMRKAAPGATFLAAPREVMGSEMGSCDACNICPHMKLNTLEKLYRCLRDLAPRLELDPELLVRARRPIDRMLAAG